MGMLLCPEVWAKASKAQKANFYEYRKQITKSTSTTVSVNNTTTRPESTIPIPKPAIHTNTSNCSVH
jgi:hypothetical protein